MTLPVSSAKSTPTQCVKFHIALEGYMAAQKVKHHWVIRTVLLGAENSCCVWLWLFKLYRPVCISPELILEMINAKDLRLLDE